MNQLRATASQMANECLCFRARRVSRALTRAYDEALRPLGLNAPQVMLLAALAMGREGGAAMGALADALVMDRTTLSRNLRPLEKAGLLRIVPSPDDARARLVLLTPEGQRVVEEALPLWQQAQRRLTAALGADAAADLRDRLDAVVAAAGTAA